MIAIEKKERISGAAATILFHVLLLLLFFLMKLPKEEIIPGEEGTSQAILIDFGSSADGMGNQKAVEPQKNVPEPPTKQNTASQPDETSATQNLEATPVVVPKTTKQEKTPEPQPDQNLLNVLNKVNSKSGANSGNGPGQVVGDMGDPSGTDSNEYSLVSGSSVKGKIKGSGRKMIGDVAIHDDSQEIGIVAVEIIVNKYGKVIKAEPILMGSTTTSSHLWKKAKDGLINQILFNQSAKGEEAYGTIYINFSVR